PSSTKEAKKRNLKINTVTADLEKYTIKNEFERNYCNRCISFYSGKKSIGINSTNKNKNKNQRYKCV
ncbi:MAG: hypothetical protein KAS30_02250, partial [Candidatus Diapherotrites archaeon]|nr:hypothetical protein [Candidatus Diapherotrites archaeon]